MKRHNIIKTLLLAVVFLAIYSPMAFAQAPCVPTGLFGDLICKGSEIFLGMRDIIYVVSGFGIIGVAIGGFFGTINWKWLGAIIIGLMVIATTAAIIEFITDEEITTIEDSLK